MLIARVVGQLVATQKHASHEGCKLLLVAEWPNEAAYKDFIESYRFQEYYDNAKEHGRRFTVWHIEPLD